MAWPTEAGAVIGRVKGGIAIDRKYPKGTITDPSVFRGKYYGAMRGRYRIFNANVYRFYRSLTGPPNASSTPFETNASLPYTTTAVWADGTWYVSMSYFNGVIDSGFYPVGPQGETYLILEISSGAAVTGHPNPPSSWGLKLLAGGVVNVLGWYNQTGDDRAEQWVVTFTTDGTEPAENTEGDYQETMPTTNIAVLDYDITGQVHGTTVKVRLQTRREVTEGVYAYSRDSVVLTATADAEGPSAPDVLTAWHGKIPTEDI